jgi:hypothetical protein
VIKKEGQKVIEQSFGWTPTGVAIEVLVSLKVVRVNCYS